MKLISMTDFVLAKNMEINTPAEAAFLSCARYAQFLRKELIPEVLASFDGSNENLVLFKGFTITKDDSYLDLKINGFEFVYNCAEEVFEFMSEEMNLSTIEQLYRFFDANIVELELTEVALQMLK